MLTLQSPAKINLFLRITERRLDGFHNLASLFQAIDLCDTMDFERSERDTLTCNDPSLATDESNLVARARHLFRSKTGINTCFSIHLHKRIPMEAGLGGGSSNAATTLWALNSLSGKPASDAQLAAWAGEIGSDISFFLSSGTAYCTGRGEILRDVPKLQNQTLWIVKPSFGLSTKHVFGKLNVSLLPPRDPEKALSTFYQADHHYFNDLEYPVFEILPELAELKEKLLVSGFNVVSMTGTGSSFFCIGDGDLSGFSECMVFKSSFMNRPSNSWY
jgi:4-diphosphocytidyl-2-C-methyl-D-erythritol kinase